MMRPSSTAELWIVAIPWSTASRSSRRAPARQASGGSPLLAGSSSQAGREAGVAVVEHDGEPADQVVGVFEFRAALKEPVQAGGDVKAAAIGVSGFAQKPGRASDWSMSADGSDAHLAA